MGTRVGLRAVPGEGRPKSDVILAQQLGLPIDLVVFDAQNQSDDSQHIVNCVPNDRK